MAKKKLEWKKGRGKIGVLAPLIGSWKTKAHTPMGPVQCTRSFTPILGGSYVRLDATWKFSKGEYVELAVLGANQDGKVSFWSFTSDGKRSEGSLADVTDIHPQAIGFEAQMPAGLARMAYWPDEVEGFRWAVEAKTKKGWRRFTEHHYTAM
jgi:hypothetical protein